jgi:hypothetical protein
MNVVLCAWTLVLFCATIRSQRYTFDAINTTSAFALLLFFAFFRKFVKKTVEKLTDNINCLYICNDFKNEMQNEFLQTKIIRL